MAVLLNRKSNYLSFLDNHKESNTIMKYLIFLVDCGVACMLPSTNLTSRKFITRLCLLCWLEKSLPIVFHHYQTIAKSFELPTKQKHLSSHCIQSCHWVHGRSYAWSCLGDFEITPSESTCFLSRCQERDEKAFKLTHYHQGSSWRCRREATHQQSSQGLALQA